MVSLTELERDALTELVNVGVGRAATHLSRMVSDQVLLSVPSIDIVPREEAARLLSARESSGLVAVQQAFESSFSGRALLIFPETNSLELVRAVLSSELSLEEIVDLEQDALAEIGNIILNSCLVVIANSLKETLSISLPHVMRGGVTRIFREEDSDRGELVLFLYIDFSVRNHSIRGYIALLMGLSSLEALKALIDGFVDHIAAETPHGIDPV